VTDRAIPRVAVPSAAERLHATVQQLARAWTRLGREEARRRGLSLPQLFLLGALRESGPMPVTRWVAMMGLSASATSSLTDGLESGGFVARTHGARDRRQVLVSLTPKGRRVADRLRAASRRRWTEFCAGLPPGDLGAAATTLGRVVGRMNELAGEGKS
jgi:DNA-binding MarR family transcriptional regulator